MHCGCGSWGGRCLSMGDSVTGRGPRGGRPLPKGANVASLSRDRSSAGASNTSRSGPTSRTSSRIIRSTTGAACRRCGSTNECRRLGHGFGWTLRARHEVSEPDLQSRPVGDHAKKCAAYLVTSPQATRAIPVANGAPPAALTSPRVADAYLGEAIIEHEGRRLGRACARDHAVSTTIALTSFSGHDYCVLRSLPNGSRRQGHPRG